MNAKMRLKELAAYGENNQTLQKWLKAQGHHFKGKVHVNYGWSGGKDSTMHKVYSPRFKTEDDRLTVNETPNGEMKIYQGMNYRSPLHVIPAKQAKNMNAKMRLKELAAATNGLRLKELARGDRAIPALKGLLKRGVGNGGTPISIHEIGISGTTIPGLRGNVNQVRRASRKFWGEDEGLQTAAAQTRNIRKWAANTLREGRR
jgi:hypothetical protein